MTRRGGGGLTMIELAVTIAVIAVLAALAIPAFNARFDRQRLAAAAEAYAADLSEARFEAAKRGEALFVEATPGERNWCWAIATQSGCDCATAQPCQLRNVPAKTYAGVQLQEARPVRMDPAGTTDSLTGAVFASRRGDKLRVDLQALGRVRICVASGPELRYPKC